MVAVHCSIWTYVGDPDELTARYERMVEALPAANMRFTACARTPTGIVLFDTCPSKEAYDAFFASSQTQAFLVAHGLDAPESIVDYPVVRAYAGGRRVDC